MGKKETSEVYKVVTGKASTSYHSSKESAISRARQDLERYSKGEVECWLSSVYRTRLTGGDPDFVAERLTLGDWRWPECQDLIITLSTTDGGATYRYDYDKQEEVEDKKQEDDEGWMAKVIRRELFSFVEQLGKTGHESHIVEYIDSLHEVALLFKPILTKTLYDELMGTDESTPPLELSDLHDRLYLDCSMSLDNSKAMELARDMAALNFPDNTQTKVMRMMLKALLDTRK